MHSSEWLSKAKQVPVGQKRRVDHGCGATKSLDVWNNSDSWSAYCHRCKTSGRQYKEFYEEVPKDTIVYRKYCNDKDLVELTELAQKHQLWYKRVIVLLQAKGVSTELLRAVGARLKYNVMDHRLVLKFPRVDLGRDCTGTNGAKWLRYYRDDGDGYLYLQGENVFDKRVCITEDFFSAAKIRYYTGLSALCLLGTSLDDTKVHLVMNKAVYVCTDGDQAGYDCYDQIKRRLAPLGVDVLNKITDGYDPKDLTPQELRDLLL